MYFKKCHKVMSIPKDPSFYGWSKEESNIVKALVHEKKMWTELLTMLDRPEKEIFEAYIYFRAQKDTPKGQPMAAMDEEIDMMKSDHKRVISDFIRRKSEEEEESASSVDELPVPIKEESENSDEDEDIHRKVEKVAKTIRKSEEEDSAEENARKLRLKVSPTAVLLVRAKQQDVPEPEQYDEVLERMLEEMVDTLQQKFPHISKEGIRAQMRAILSAKLC